MSRSRTAPHARRNTRPLVSASKSAVRLTALVGVPAMLLVWLCAPGLAAAQDDTSADHSGSEVNHELAGAVSEATDNTDEDSEPDDDWPWAADTSGTAPPRHWTYVRQLVGTAVGPLGLLSDTRIEQHIPLHRSDSAVFQNTYAGIGLRAAITPAFIDLGPRLTIAPLDIFDVVLQAGWVNYLPGENGLIRFDEISPTTASAREEFADITPWGTIISVTANPTLKLRVGPVIAFDTWSFAWLRATRNDAVDVEPYIFEPLRDLTIAWEDLIIEHQAAVVVVAWERGDAHFWAGVTVKDIRSTETLDRSTFAAALFLFRPTDQHFMPRFLIMPGAYVTDEDYSIGASFAAIWSFSRGTRSDPDVLVESATGLSL